MPAAPRVKIARYWPLVQRDRQTSRGMPLGIVDGVDQRARHIDSYNEPFTWTKTADELLDKIKRKSITNTRR
jgi:hypothetical protein